MNKIYKLKYDKRRNQFVAVSELTAGAGKEVSGQVTAAGGLTDPGTFRQWAGVLTPFAFLTGLVMSFLPGIALANPDLPAGGQIIMGQGSISSTNNQMTINQNTHGMVTNWSSFDIGANNTVKFVQPDSSSVALNRVTGGHESQILGTLTANGQVMLVNPAGVMFGQGAKVNTAGLVASTKNISNADFMAGHYTFSGGSKQGAEVVNQGNLTTSKGGYIVLAADRVKNSGNISTPGGQTVLAAGEKVTLQLDNTGLASVSVSGSVVNALVENSGLLSATDGQVYLTARGKDMLLNTVVNNTGTVEASGLSGQGGEIVLNGGGNGVVSQSGGLLADSETGRGGTITVEGENIYLAANSRTSATGRTGGGEVYVGGGWQGKDSHIHNASKVVVDKTATLDVSATENGDGGTAVLWSEDYTNFRGIILARGGALSGNGGQVETSSHGNLQAFGDVDASGPVGYGGNWLLDPLNVEIVNAGNAFVTESSNDDHIFSPSASGAKVGVKSIENQLNSGVSVTVDTHHAGSQSGNITFASNAQIKKTSLSDATLTLKADKDIEFINRGWSALNDIVKGAITSVNGKLNLNLLAGDSGQNGLVKIGNHVHLFLNGGDIIVGPAKQSSGNTSLFFNNAGIIDAGNITLNTAGGTTGNFYNLNATENLTVTGPLSVTAGFNLVSNIKAGHLLNITADSGDIIFNATSVNGDSAGGKILIDGNDGVTIQAKNGHLTMNVNDKNKNEVSVRSDEGSVSVSGTVQDGSTGLSLTNVNITSKDKTTLDGTTFWGKGTVLSGLSVTSGGNTEISGIARNLKTEVPGRASSSGVVMTGSEIESTGGNVKLTGFSGTDEKNQAFGGVDIRDSSIKANARSGSIVLGGTTESTTGLRVTGGDLSATSLDVTGVATIKGTGFSLTGTHLLNDLADLNNVTFSSKGSAAGAMNVLGSNIVTVNNLANLLKWHPDNMTSINMGGSSIFNGTGWKTDFTSSNTPNGGWIFSNAVVTASDTVDLKGVSFTDSTINVTGGDFRLANNGKVMLNNDRIAVTDGGIDVSSLSGDVSLSGGNISAKKDISLTTENGGVVITGGININSGEGSIDVAGNATGKKTDGIFLRNASLTAEKGHITLNGVSDYYNIDTGIGGVRLRDNVGLTSMLNTVTGKNTLATIQNNFGGIVGNEGKFTFTGNTVIDAESIYAGMLFNVFGKKDAEIHFRNGTATINARDTNNKNDGGGQYFSGMSIVQNEGEKRIMIFDVDNANLNINSSAVYAPGISAVYPDFGDSDVSSSSGYEFRGKGDVRLEGNSEFGDGVELRALNNEKLDGTFTVVGKSKSKSGVVVPRFADVHVKSATISGSSGTGVGIRINAGDNNAKEVNLNGNIIDGKSEASDGVIIRGGDFGKVIVSDGSLKGTSGSGRGVVFSGGKDYVIDGVIVTGDSVEGTGVSVSGNVSVQGSTKIAGTSTKSTGVDIKGTLAVNKEDKDEIFFTGASVDGTGILLGGSVSGGTLTGESVNGTGFKVTNGGQVTDVKINAQTVNGKAIDGDNNVLTTGGDTHISTFGETGNAGISEGVSPVPDAIPSGVVKAELLGKLNMDIASLQNVFSTKFADLADLQQTLANLRVQLSEAGTSGMVAEADLKRLETTVSSLQATTNVVAELNDTFSALKTAESESLVERQKTADSLRDRIQGVTLPGPGDISALAGEFIAAKAFHLATVSLQSGLVDKAEEGSKVQHFLDSLQQQLKDAQENGLAGETVLQGLQAQLEGLNEQQQSGRGVLENLQRTLETVIQDGSSPDGQWQTRVDALQKAASGIQWATVGRVSELGSKLRQTVNEHAQIVLATQGQGSVNAQTSLRNRALQDGFHAGDELLVPVSGYLVRSRNVDISLCDGKVCQSMTLNVGKPAQGLMKTASEQ